jgi:N-acetylglucosamine malate deacetylase 1
LPLDLLVFGPHPDDIEIGLGGTVARHVAMGYSVGLCDLTRGELGSNGTPDQRMAEAQAAASVLGVAWRRNLGWPDGRIGQADRHLREVVDIVRQERPRVIAVPYVNDRHPDHAAASRMLTTAVFRSGLRRFPASGEAWRPDWTVYYFVNDSALPSFVVDVSDYYEIKRRSLACHRSQFDPVGPDAVPTRLTSQRFMQLIESRDAQFGALAGVPFAEGFVVRDPIVRPHLLKDWGARPAATGGDVI